jgi:hypothetical protein
MEELTNSTFPFFCELPVTGTLVFIPLNCVGVLIRILMILTEEVVLVCGTSGAMFTDGLEVVSAGVDM